MTEPDTRIAPLLDRSRLVGFERIAVPLCDFLNLNLSVKRLVQLFPATIGAGWISLFGRRRWVLNGLEHVRDLEPPRGVILVSNHRSFFDMYLCSAALYKHARFMRRLVFPVRSGFFYDHPLGLLVNLSISGGAMWPPMFRDERRATLNPIGLQQVSHVLGKRGCVVGYHPEGTRNKGPDPYTFLPARAGLGRLMQAAHPDTLVVPYFILGMENKFLDEIRLSIRPPPDGSRRIRITYGAPFRVGDFDLSGDGKAVSERVLDVVRQLGELDRAEQEARAEAA
jgi:1-acyl-sn-glycerol-3-phosphate acyltransferase